MPLFLFASVHGSGELFLEFVDTSCCIHKLQFTRVKGMADTANIDLEFRSGCSCSKLISATTGYLGFNVLWMDIFFHDNFRNGGRLTYFTQNCTPIVLQWEKMEGGRRFDDSVPLTHPVSYFLLVAQRSPRIR